MPDGQAGQQLTFKALQTYDDGEVVRWIGPEDADEPAPIVTLTAAASGGGHGAPGTDPDTAVSSDDGASGAQEPAQAPAENTSATVEADGGSDGLAIAALAVAVVALAAAGASYLRRTR